jgi:hypothetical protein
MPVNATIHPRNCTCRPDKYPPDEYEEIYRLYGRHPDPDLPVVKDREYYEARASYYRRKERMDRIGAMRVG